MPIAASSLATLRTRILQVVRDVYKTHWDQTQVDEALRAEWFEMYDYVIERMESFFAPTETLYSWPANTRLVTISGATVLNSVTYHLVQVGVTPRVAAISSTNPVTHLTRMQTPMLAFGGLEAPAEVFDLLALHGGAGRPMGYVLEGHAMELVPMPTATQQVVFRTLAAAPDLPGTSTNAVISDERLARFEPMLIYGAALRLMAKDKESSDPAAVQYRISKDALVSFLERWGRRGEPHYRVSTFGRA